MKDNMKSAEGPVMRRKIYRRGSSFETTVPMPLLFSADLSKKNDILFRLDRQANRWYVEFEESKIGKSADNSKRQKKRV